MYRFSDFVAKRDRQEGLSLVEELRSLPVEEQVEALKEFFDPVTLGLAGAGVAAAGVGGNWLANKLSGRNESIGTRLNRWYRNIGNIGRDFRLNNSGLTGVVQNDDPLYDQKIQAVNAGLAGSVPKDPQLHQQFAAKLDKLVRRPDFEQQLQNATARKYSPERQQQYWQQVAANQRARAGAEQAMAGAQLANRQEVVRLINHVLTQAVNSSKLPPEQKKDWLAKIQQQLASQRF